MATLVTGGTGFVGANIVRSLAQAGHEVVCFDLNGPDQMTQGFMHEISSKVSYVQGDMLDWPLIERLGAEHSIDRIVHAAVFTVNRVELETQRSRDVIAINIEGTANLLELARALKVDRFAYISSGAVYGSAAPGDQTLNEDTPPVPLNLYGITKYASELLPHPTLRDRSTGFRLGGRGAEIPFSTRSFAAGSARIASPRTCCRTLAA